MLLRALLVALVVAGCVVGCSTMGECSERASFSVYANPNGVNISGYEAFDCKVTFSSQGRSAVTTMKARSAPTTAPPPVAPTMTDEVAACAKFDPSDAQFCSQTSGPAYESCARTPTCLRVLFLSDPGAGMDAYLGATGTYDVRVECGGIVITYSTNVSSRYQQCLG